MEHQILHQQGLHQLHQFQHKIQIIKLQIHQITWY